MLASNMPSWPDAVRMMPEIVLIAIGTMLMVLEPTLPKGRKSRCGYLALGGLVVALGATFALAGAPEATAFNGMVVLDGFTTFFRAIVIVVGLLTVLCSIDYIERERPGSAEYYRAAAVLDRWPVPDGGVGRADHGLHRPGDLLDRQLRAGRLPAAQRRATTSPPLSTSCSVRSPPAFLLYGVAWIYGATGSTNLTAIREALAGANIDTPFLAVGASAALIFVGLAFKVSAAPFQVWAADVYEGAPAPGDGVS